MDFIENEEDKEDNEEMVLLLIDTEGCSLDENQMSTSDETS